MYLVSLPPGVPLPPLLLGSTVVVAQVPLAVVPGLRLPLGLVDTRFVLREMVAVLVAVVVEVEGCGVNVEGGRGPKPASPVEERVTAAGVSTWWWPCRWH